MTTEKPFFEWHDAEWKKSSRVWKVLAILTFPAYVGGTWLYWFRHVKGK